MGGWVGEGVAVFVLIFCAVNNDTIFYTVDKVSSIFDDRGASYLCRCLLCLYW